MDELHCVVCDEMIEGELQEVGVSPKDLNMSFDDKVTGHGCGNCSAVVCSPLKSISRWGSSPTQKS